MTFSILRVALIALAFCLVGHSALSATPAPAIPQTCAAQAPWGAPLYRDPAPLVVVLCRSGYVAEFNTERLVADFVSWSLTGAHALGCLPRVNSFAPDPDLPPQWRVGPDDYRGSGFDRGHFAPNSDFQWDEKAERESFYMSNMSPQAPHLNQWEWEELEAATRSWALDRGRLIIMTGPIWRGVTAMIGARRIGVPTAYWKVIVDPRTLEFQAYVMPNRPIAKGNLSPYITTVSEVENLSGLMLPLPNSVRHAQTIGPWPINLAVLTSAKKRECRGLYLRP